MVCRGPDGAGRREVLSAGYGEAGEELGTDERGSPQPVSLSCGGFQNGNSRLTASMATVGVRESGFGASRHAADGRAVGINMCKHFFYRIYGLSYRSVAYKHGGGVRGTPYHGARLGGMSILQF